MKDELRAYIALYKDRDLDAVPFSVYGILLPLFFIAIVFTNLIAGIVFAGSFLLFYFLNKKIQDEYQRKVLTIALLLSYEGIGSFFAIDILYSYIIIPHIVAVVVSLISYEIVFLIKIRMRIYSSKNPKKRKAAGGAVMFSATMGGFLLAKLFSKSKFIATDIKVWVGVLINCMIIMGSFMYFQKFLILKTLR